MAFFIKNGLKTQFFAYFLVKHVENKQKSRFWAIFWPPSPKTPPKRGGIFGWPEKTHGNMAWKSAIFHFSRGTPLVFSKKPQKSGVTPPRSSAFPRNFGKFAKKCQKMQFFEKKGGIDPPFKGPKRRLFGPRKPGFSGPLFAYKISKNRSLY